METLDISLTGMSLVDICRKYPEVVADSITNFNKGNQGPSEVVVKEVCSEFRTGASCRRGWCPSMVSCGRLPCVLTWYPKDDPKPIPKAEIHPRENSPPWAWFVEQGYSKELLVLPPIKRVERVREFVLGQPYFESIAVGEVECYWRRWYSMRIEQGQANGKVPHEEQYWLPGEEGKILRTGEVTSVGAPLMNDVTLKRDLKRAILLEEVILPFDYPKKGTVCFIGLPGWSHVDDKGK